MCIHFIYKYTEQVKNPFGGSGVYRYTTYQKAFRAEPTMFSRSDPLRIPPVKHMHKSHGPQSLIPSSDAISLSLLMTWHLFPLIFAHAQTKAFFYKLVYLYRTVTMAGMAKAFYGRKEYLSKFRHIPYRCSICTPLVTRQISICRPARTVHGPTCDDLYRRLHAQSSLTAGKGGA